MSKPASERVAGLAAPPRSWRAAAVAVPVAAVAATLLALAVGAFWPRYLAEPFATIDRYTHAHAAIGLAWMVLLVAQPLAVHRGRSPLHRALGRAAWLLAPAFVVSGVLLAHARFAAMDDATLASEGYFLYLPLATALLFALAAALGIAYRRTTALHARFMAVTGLLLIDPVVVRLLAFNLPPWPGLTTYQVFTYALTDAGVVGLMRWFRPRIADPRPLWALFAVIVVVQAGWFLLATSTAWAHVVLWFRALPLT